MEQYIVWILLAVCVGAHFWMMRKMRHGIGHDGHDGSHTHDGCCGGHDGKGHNEHDEKKECGTYTCPMHSEMKQDKPGSCQDCGMNLVPAKN